MDTHKHSLHEQTETSPRLFLRSHSGAPRASRPVSCLVFLFGCLLGLGIGVLSTLLYISSAHDVSAPPSQAGSGVEAIVVQLNATYLSQVVAKEIPSAGIPGKVKNVQVKLEHNTPITISGDDELTFFGLSMTRRFTLQLQPVINACRLHVTITHADLGGIPVTSFVSSFEDQMNRQLQKNSDNSLLPSGFNYCMTNVRTETNSIFLTYTARPV